MVGGLRKISRADARVYRDGNVESLTSPTSGRGSRGKPLETSLDPGGLPMHARRSRHSRHRSRVLTPWYRQEVGGLPVWAMIVIALAVAGLVAFTVTNMPA